MKAIISWWDLDGSEQSIDSLRADLRHQGVRVWTETHGLVLKLWVSDRENNRWGAVQVWENDGPGDQSPPNRAAKIIGYPPTHRFSFDIEASVEGLHTVPGLVGYGRAFEDPPSTDATWTRPIMAGAV
jgi:hypothetical protein